jgi:hypothetical protein
MMLTTMVFPLASMLCTAQFIAPSGRAKRPPTLRKESAIASPFAGCIMDEFMRCKPLPTGDSTTLTPGQGVVCAQAGGHSCAAAGKLVAPPGTGMRMRSGAHHVQQPTPLSALSRLLHTMPQSRQPHARTQRGTNEKGTRSLPRGW